MIQRGGDVVMRMLEHVQQVTIQPLIQATIAPGTGVYTDADDIDNRLGPGGDEHARVCHGRGE
jgi:transposase